ncbi:hypothetical protein GF371_04630, partial [Candidatus Woesearchaeota archaeon]|nr:hypothetical protein [Candidatus Woesearchaeota archaeon]
LLQVLEEGTATIGSYTIDLPANFIFIGTMNPEDFAGTERLSEVFMDRFDLIYMGYPEDKETEKNIVLRSGERLEVEFPGKLMDLMIEFVGTLRKSKDLERKPSVRATIGLYERAQSNSYLNGRKKVGFYDIQDSLLSVLRHRIKLKPSIKYLKDVSDFIKEEFNNFLQSNSQYKGLMPEKEEGDAG